jgi:hypothetical protein
MRSPDTANWIRLGLLALPIYGVLTWSSLDPQPDPNTHYEAWSRYVTTDHYVLTYVFGSILGLILAIFGRSPWAPTSPEAAPDSWGW